MTTETTLAALRLSDQLGPTLVRKLIDVSVRIRTRETLFRDDEIVGEAAYALKEAIEQADNLRAALSELLACHTESAGWSMSMLADRAEFDAMIQRSQERLENAVGAARVALGPNA